MINQLSDLTIQWLGTMDYEDALIAQAKACERVRAGGHPVVLACEHPAVITLGKRGQALSDLLVSMETLREKEIDIVATDRGGQATLHNPGQLVLYPILPLKDWQLGVRDYVESLERASAYFFAEFGIEVARAYEPGLWVHDKKIAAFGIRVDRGVSLHGLALNIKNDLTLFSLIRLCGQAVEATNLSQEMSEFMEEIPRFDMSICANHWLEHFKAQLMELKISSELDEKAPEILKEEPLLTT